MQSGPSLDTDVIDCARIIAKKKTYLVNYNGYIQPFNIDNIEEQLRLLGISSTYYSILIDIVQANLVYSCAKKFCLVPGLFSESDELIEQELDRHIDIKIYDDPKKEIVKSLIASWNRVAASPLAKPFKTALADDTIPYDQPKLTVFVYYEAFVKKYFEGLICQWPQADIIDPNNLWFPGRLLYSYMKSLHENKTINKNGVTEPTPKNDKDTIRFYLNLTEILFSSLSFRPYRRNEFLNHELIEKSLQVIINDIEKNQNSINIDKEGQKDTQKDTRCDYLKSIRALLNNEKNDIQKKCYIPVKGTAMFFADDDLKKQLEKPEAEREFTKEELAIALQNILKRSDGVCNNDYLNRLLKEVFQFNRNPYGKHELCGVDKHVFKEERANYRISEREIRRYMHESVECYFVKLARENGFKLDTEFQLPKALLIARDENTLRTLLCDGAVEPYKLFSLFALSKDECTKDMIRNIVHNDDTDNPVQSHNQDIGNTAFEPPTIFLPRGLPSLLSFSSSMRFTLNVVRRNMPSISQSAIAARQNSDRQADMGGLSDKLSHLALGPEKREYTETELKKSQYRRVRKAIALIDKVEPLADCTDQQQLCEAVEDLTQSQLFASQSPLFTTQRPKSKTV